jgi:hypothetical protein
MRATPIVPPAVLLLAALSFGCNVLPPASTGAAPAGTAASANVDVKAKLEGYASEVERLEAALAGALAGGEISEASRKSFAENLDRVLKDLVHDARLRLSLFPAALKEQVALVEKFKDFRLEKINALRPSLPEDPAHRPWAQEELRKENAVYLEKLQELLADKMVRDHTVRVDVFKRKYFSGGEDDKGNFLEGYINGKVPLFTSTEEPTDESWYRTAGVSHFESTLRLEPLVVFDSEENAAALATAGLVYHFFPKYDPQGFDANPSEDFLSQWVQRLGLRAGLGAQDREDEGLDFIIGAGLQVRSFTIWGVYNTEEDDVSAAFGVSDFKFLSGVLPIF